MLFLPLYYIIAGMRYENGYYNFTEDYEDGRYINPEGYFREKAVKRARKKTRRRAFRKTVRITLFLALCVAVFMYFRPDLILTGQRELPNLPSLSSIKALISPDTGNGIISQWPVTSGKEEAAVYTVPESSTVTSGTVAAGQLLRYRASLLSGEDYENYVLIKNAISNFSSSVSFRTDNVERFMEIASSVYYDYPEYFWFDGDVRTSYHDTFGLCWGEIFFEYNCTAEQQAAMKAQLESSVAGIVSRLRGLPTYDAVKGVYEYIIGNTVYDISQMDQSCYSVLVNGRGVCAGYTNAFHYILHRLGIDCIYVKGVSKGEDHAWSMVRLDGDWYQVDVTWGDPVMDDGSQTISYDYLMLTDPEMLKDHSYSGDISYPVCTAETYNFYRYEGLYLLYYDVEALRGMLSRCLYGGKDFLVKCADESVYYETVARLFDGEEVWQLLKSFGLASNGDTIYYVCSPEHLTIDISL